jgi:energy-coupling factor transporter ATP-binding protein EcfA2
MIRCEGLAFAYPDGTVALRGIDLAIEAGERVAIVGPNGGGKSTLVRTWNGLLRPTAGQVLVDGRPTAGRRVAQLARTVGLAFQDPDLQLFRGSCRDEVAFGAGNVGLRGDELDRSVDAALDAVGLADRGRANPYDLGGSWRRLLAVASVLAMRTPVVVLHEPTRGLDTRRVEAVRAAIEGLAGEGRTVVAISHDARFVRGSFERVVRLQSGRVAANGTPAEVLG